MTQKILFIFCLLCIAISCGEDDNQNQGYSPTPVNIAVPAIFSQLLPAPEIPANNHSHKRVLPLEEHCFMKKNYLQTTPWPVLDVINPIKVLVISADIALV